MKFRILMAVLLPILALAILASAEEKKQTAAQDKQAAMMKAWTEFATPGAPHKMLQNLVGTWDANVKSYDPNMGPQESKGTSTVTSVMDGRYFQESVESSFNGMPFHGQGTYGYDNLQKKYFATWIDSMGTGIMTSEGTSDDGGKTIHWTARSSDPMSGKVQTYHSTMKMISQDQYQFEMFAPAEGGKETKVMEISYTRKK